MLEINIPNKTPLPSFAIIITFRSTKGTIFSYDTVFNLKKGICNNVIGFFSSQGYNDDSMKGIWNNANVFL
jgi:hypothetical protein